MALEWSEPREPCEACRYDHAVAATPLGEICLEWKSWKLYPSVTAQMPWDEFIVGHDLDDAKAKVQAAWDKMIPTLTDLCSGQ